jgi:hypothetical protein
MKRGIEMSDPQLRTIRKSVVVVLIAGYVQDITLLEVLSAQDAVDKISLTSIFA